VSVNGYAAADGTALTAARFASARAPEAWRSDPCARLI
jgi:hypothetical protein